MASSGWRPRRKRLGELVAVFVTLAGALAHAPIANGAPARPRPGQARPKPKPAPGPAPASAGTSSPPVAPATSSPVAPVVGAAGPSHGAPAPATQGDSLDDDAAALPSDTAWRQLMMAPRVGGNLRGVAVDPTNPASIYVVTEASTLVHSSDAGVSWDEVDLSPFLVKSPTIALSPSFKPPAIDVFSGLWWKVDSINWQPYSPLSRPSADIGPGFAMPFFYNGVPPKFILPFAFEYAPERLLAQVAAADPVPYEHIRRVTVCPGGAFSVYVLSHGRLLGSTDGIAFVTLFTARDSAPLGGIACSPANPNEVILTTGDGTFRSIDGGSSFDAMGGDFGAAGSYAVTFGPATDGGTPLLYVGTGRDLWRGDAAHPETMTIIEGASEGVSFINHMTATTRSIVLATDNGLRTSRDGGATWTFADDLEGMSWDMVAVAGSHGGSEQVLALKYDAAYEDIPGTTSFRPSFAAQSRRGLRQVVALPATRGAPPGFLLLTNGDLWTTSPVAKTPNASDERARKWAEQRLANMPGLAETLERALEKAEVSTGQVDALEHRMRRRGWIPSLGIYGTYGVRSNTIVEEVTISNPVRKSTGTSDQFYAVNANLVWELPEIGAPSRYNVAETRRNLYDVRKRLAFVVEDAFVERRQVLGRLSGGGLDSEQLLSLQTRAELLDFVLEQLTGTTESPP